MTPPPFDARLLPLDAPLAGGPGDGAGEGFAARLVALRRHLHMYPEVGRQERATSQLIRTVLEASGLTVNGPLAGTGLYVDVEGRRPGRRVGYRADIDALPIQDAKDVPYASRRPGVAHLCGHDVHTTVGLGVALLLHRQRDALGGTVRVFFQPNEEGLPSGAPDMIRDGVLDGLEAAYAIHVDPSLDAGRYGVIAGPATAAVDIFEVVVRAGRTGHSARPHEARDTVWIATQVAQSYYQLAGRITDARNPAVLTICRFHGGEAFNVIPAEVAFGGTLRTTDAGDRDLLLDRMEHIARDAGATFDTDVDVRVSHGPPPVRNDARLADHLDETIRATCGDAAVFRIPRPSMGAEDFAYYLEHLPGALLRVGTRSGAETAYPLHHARFDVDEGTILPTARLMARVLTEHLGRNFGF